MLLPTVHFTQLPSLEDCRALSARKALVLVDVEQLESIHVVKLDVGSPALPRKNLTTANMRALVESLPYLIVLLNNFVWVQAFGKPTSIWCWLLVVNANGLFKDLNSCHVQVCPPYTFSSSVVLRFISSYKNIITICKT